MPAPAGRSSIAGVHPRTVGPAPRSTCTCVPLVAETEVGCSDQHVKKTMPRPRSLGRGNAVAARSPRARARNPVWLYGCRSARFSPTSGCPARDGTAPTPSTPPKASAAPCAWTTAWPGGATTSIRLGASPGTWTGPPSSGTGLRCSSGARATSNTWRQCAPANARREALELRLPRSASGSVAGLAAHPAGGLPAVQARLLKVGTYAVAVWSRPGPGACLFARRHALTSAGVVLTTGSRPARRWAVVGAVGFSLGRRAALVALSTLEAGTPVLPGWTPPATAPLEEAD